MMQRYFIELAYNGAEFYGWQKQPRQISVQEAIEDALSTILGQSIEVIGCGRTDTAVHARQYFAHFNFSGVFPKRFLARINKFLPPDIVFYRIFPVHWDAHTRFDAYHRSYEYHLTLRKDPFHPTTITYHQLAQQPDIQLMQEAAKLLLNYEEFFPFCKTNNDAKTMRCTLYRSEWEVFPDEERLVYHISANRFLRGMVRLIVGMCINVGMGKTSLQEVEQALQQQTRLKRSNSAPPQGLFLTDIRYPYIDEKGIYQAPDSTMAAQQEEE